MQRTALTGAIAGGIALALVLAVCAVQDRGTTPDQAGGRGTDRVTGSGPLRVRLSTGDRVTATPVLNVAEGEPLSRERIDEILGRLPEFATDQADRQDFNRPATSLPPPTVNTTTEVAFPPPDAAPPAPSDPGPLEVLRHQPEGDVAVAPYLSLTFNQDIVPVGTLEQLDQRDAPVVVTPALPGRWRWIGTRTLRYEHAGDGIDRLPAATSFTVEVPAGTTSVDGDTLDEAFRWTFRTPAATVNALTPDGDSLPLEPVFVATFDQRVDPAAVLRTITLEANREAQPIRLATTAEVDGDDAARQAMAQGLDGRAVAFRAERPLEPASRLTIRIGPGTPSAEGPRTTEDEQTFRARTFGAFRLVRDSCSHGPTCPPGSAFLLSFSNPIDPATLDRDDLRIRPALPGVVIDVFGSDVVIHGATTANTTYEVTVPGDLRDTHGQALGEAVTATFDVGESLPALHQFARELTTADPYAEAPQTSVVSVGHDQLRVRLLEVSPEDWPAYLRWSEKRYEPGFADGTLPFPVTVDRTVDTGARSDGLPVETTIDLADAIGGNLGHVVVLVEPTVSFPQDDETFWNNRPVVTWVQVTALGIDAFSDSQRLIGWVTDLRDGSPVADATVSSGRSTATTDGSGLATLPLGGGVVVASKGDDTALLGSRYGEWSGQAQRDQLRWYTIDDRGLYRPGETVHVKGVVRRIRLDAGASVVGVGGDPSVRYQVSDPHGVPIADGTVDVSDLGTFDLAFELPPGTNLGQAFVNLTLVGAPGPVDGEQGGHQFRVDEFRRPSFEVVTREEGTGPHVVQDPVTVSVAASYFAGGAVGDAPITWTVTHRDTTYAPPNWPSFTFGEWVPWWNFGRGGFDSGFGGGGYASDIGFPCCGPGGFEEPTIERFDATTDAGGRHALRIDLEGEAPDQPVSVSANAAVTDIDAQQLAGTVDLLVHPARFYVGMRTPRTFVRAGESLDVDLIVTGIDGEVAAGRRVEVTAARLEDRNTNGEYEEVAVDERTCEVTSADEPVACSFRVDTGGRYRVTAIVTDDDGGRQRSELTRWVTGAAAVPSRTVEQEVLTLVPDQETYAVGDTARLLVIAPFEEGYGAVHVTRGDLLSSEVFSLDRGTAVLEIEVTDAMLGGAQVQVTVDGVAQRLTDEGTPDASLPPRPAVATGTIDLAVPPRTKTLGVTATPRDRALRPGATTTLDLSVTAPGGGPAAGAEVAVIVADEAVLSLLGRDLTDPAAVFHAAMWSNLRVEVLRGTIVLSRPDAVLRGEEQASGVAQSGGSTTDGSTGSGMMGDTAAEFAVPASAPAMRSSADGDDSAGGAPDAPITVRSDFDPLALFEPAVVTGADGRASVEVTVPDNLTRYRIVALAVQGEDRFGIAEASLTAREPLMVRPSAPRFLNFGDRFVFPVVLHNQTDRDLDVEVVLQGANLAVEGAGDNAGGLRVRVPAQDRVEVRLPAAADVAGTARYRAVAVSGDLADAVTADLPVYTPVTTEAFATYGVLDGQPGGTGADAVAAHRLLAPEGVVPQFGGLEFSTSSTALATLTDAVLYLADYAYESADAYASRILAIAALRDVLDAFDAEGLGGRAQADARAQADLDALEGLQNGDGGFATWRRGRPSDPYASVHGAHALIAGRAAGYAVSDNAIAQSLSYLRGIDDRIPRDWDPTARAVLVAYALHVRDLAGERDPARAARLYREETLPLDALAWIWPVVDDAAIVAEIDREVHNRVTETPGAATFTTGYAESAYLVLASDRRTDGLVLDALIRMRPDSDLIAKVVTGLIGNQRKGRWNNAQENTFILLALKRYFDTFEATTPQFVARAWLGDDYIAEHSFAGRDIDGQRTVVPMADLIDGGDRDLIVADDGTGRLYYRLGLSYAPDDLDLDARDEGFVVDRVYEAIDDPADVRRAADGTWQVRLGANVRVRLTMVADSRRTNMALVDHLPAGLEAVNPAFATAAAIRPEETEDGDDGVDLARSWWWGTWWDHQNLRDDRAEAFAAWLPGGTYEYTYVARATTPGEFVVPPAKAEEIHAPEVFGRSSSTRVIVSNDRAALPSG